MAKRLKPILCLALLLVAFAGPVAAQDEGATAQHLLFDATYLVPLGAPSRLLYGYSQKSSDPALYGQAFEDQVALRLSASAEGAGEKDVLLDLFTGERQRTVGPLTRVSGNPIIMMFLERDVLQMSRHLGGQAVYYRNIIRLAFRENAKMEPATLTWQGKDVAGTKIVIQPFKDSAQGERMQIFRSKAYMFIVSDAVPGGIYEIHSTLADMRPEVTAPASEIRLTLKDIAYVQPNN